MTDRVFRRLITKHLEINSDWIVDRIISEIKKNPDHRLGLKLIQCIRKFPRKISCKTRLISFLTSEENILPFQEAQILKAIRYQSRIKPETIHHVKRRIENEFLEDCVRVEALRLLARCDLDNAFINIVANIFLKTQSVSVKRATALILMRQRGQKNTRFIQDTVLHSNNEIRKMGRFLQKSKNDPPTARKILDQAFKENYLLVDYLPLLYLMIESRDEGLVKMVIDEIMDKSPHKNHINMDMRDRCVEILNLAKQKLSVISLTGAD